MNLVVIATDVLLTGQTSAPDAVNAIFQSVTGLFGVRSITIGSRLVVSCEVPLIFQLNLFAFFEVFEMINWFSTCFGTHPACGAALTLTEIPESSPFRRNLAVPTPAAAGIKLKPPLLEATTPGPDISTFAPAGVTINGYSFLSFSQYSVCFS